MLRPHQSGHPKRRRFAVWLTLLALLAATGATTAIAVGAEESPERKTTATTSEPGRSPLGETIPPEPDPEYTPPVSSGPQVSQGAAVTAASKEAQGESAAVAGASSATIQSAASPQAIAHTTRKIATDTIGQGQEPADASADVRTWYEGSVYLVSYTGNYVAYDAPVPPGAKAPTGKYLTLIVDAYSGKITGYELSKTADLSSKVSALADGT